MCYPWNKLTHQGRKDVYMPINKTITGSENGFAPDRAHAIIWTHAGLSLIGLMKIHFSKIRIETHQFFTQANKLIMPPSQWQPFCLGLNSLNDVTSELKKIYYGHSCLYVCALTVTIWWLLSHKNKGICQVDPSRDGTGIFRENMLKIWSLSQYKDRLSQVWGFLC